MDRRMAYRKTTHDRRNGLGLQASAPLGLLAIMAAVVGTQVAVLVWLLPAAQIPPMLSLASLAASGAALLLAWRSGAERDVDGITLWDVAGALAFLGFAAGMLSRPAHVAQLFGLATTTQ